MQTIYPLGNRKGSLFLLLKMYFANAYLVLPDTLKCSTNINFLNSHDNSLGRYYYQLFLNKCGRWRLGELSGVQVYPPRKWPSQSQFLPKQAGSRVVTFFFFLPVFKCFSITVDVQYYFILVSCIQQTIQTFI